MGIEDGLSNSNIVSIVQDRQGFIWIATQDGLNRFDANRFKVYRTSGGNENTICSNELNCLYADKNDDIIWIGTRKDGLDAFHYKTQEFVHYRQDHSGQHKNSLVSNAVTHITPDSKGNLWVATYMAGIDYFDKKTGEFTHYNQSNVKGLVSDYNWYVICDNDEKLYVGHVTEGFSIIDIAQREAVNFRHDPSDQNSLPDNTVSCLLKDYRNKIWVGTRNGLTMFDPETREMTNFKYDPDNPHSLSNNYIQSLTMTDDSLLWIGTEGGGVNIYDLKVLAETDNPHDIPFERIPVADTPDGLSSSSAHSILQDSFGNMWIGGIASGLNFIPNKEPFFKNITHLPLVGNKNSLGAKRAPDLCLDNNNQLWVANYDGGINIYKKETKIRQYHRINNGYLPQNFRTIYHDRDNNIWMATDDGRIYKFITSSQRFVSYNHFESIKSIAIYNIILDSEHNLWVSTDIGLFKYNTKSKEEKLYTSANAGLSDDNIRVTGEDSEGNIWVGTLGGGLCVFDKDMNLLYNFGKYFEFSSVNQIYKDSEDRIWVASENDLYLFPNYISSNTLRIGKNEGLAENHIRAVIEGASADEIWLSTTNGISHLNVSTMQISNFDVNDGLLRGDYLKGSVVKEPDGTIYFGSQNGITYFHHLLEKTGDYNLNTAFTNFLVASNKNNFNEFKDIPFADSVSLTYSQNTFQLFFNVLDYSIADKVEFAYQLNGLDNSWYLINNQDKYVTFRNLRPGHYTFKLKSRLHNSVWDNNIPSMYIRITPPFWLTWWAKAFYIVLAISLVYLIFKFYKNKITIENELLFEKKKRQKEQELNEDKINFFTNITHELRTPMTLILGPLEELISDPSIPEKQVKNLNSIHRVANRLSQLINQILEFRKTTNKSRKLRVLKDDFKKFIHDTSQKYHGLNNKGDVEFKVLLPDEKTEIFFDPEVVSIILDNLLSNAFKYTQKGTITLEVKNTTQDHVNYTEVLVKDTGFGIAEDELPHIFERYFQAKNKAYPVTGTGIGLAIVQNLVELHEAEIQVQSKLNQGTTFKVRFITNNSYPDVAHLQLEELQTEEDLDRENSKNVILIIDDNQEIVEYIHDCLVDNYTLISAENGQVGFEKACEKMPDVVISDIMMPVMDGITFCRNMKKDVRTSHIPIILLTAKGALQDQNEGYNAGADSYLTKPFSGSLLKSRIRNIIDTRKKLSETYSTHIKDKQVLFNESINQLDKEFLEKLNAVIEQNIEDEEMNIKQIASQLNMSHSTLYRKIKALTNLTANEYIRKVRLNVAEQLLLTSKYTISEIMYKIGINSNSYFRQCFKDEFGMNPSEYLQKLKTSSTYSAG